MRHHIDADQRHRDQPGREQHLNGHREAAAVLGVREFVDIGGHQRDLAAEPDALDEAQPKQHGVTLRARARQRAQRKDQQRGQHRAPPPPMFGDPAERDGADQLPEEADADQRADLLRRQMPQADQRRQHVGDGDRVEGVEEPCGADDQPHFQMPRTVRQPFEPRHDMAHIAARLVRRGAIGRRHDGAHRFLPGVMRNRRCARFCVACSADPIGFKTITRKHAARKSMSLVLRRPRHSGTPFGARLCSISR
jgi:hypothetical protein